MKFYSTWKSTVNKDKDETMRVLPPPPAGKGPCPTTSFVPQTQWEDLQQKNRQVYNKSQFIKKKCQKTWMGINIGKKHLSTSHTSPKLDTNCINLGRRSKENKIYTAMRNDGLENYRMVV